MPPALIEAPALIEGPALIETAETLFNAGRHADAAVACRAALVRQVDSSAALGLLGRCLIAQGRRVEGIAMLAAIQAPDAPSRLILAEALLAAGLAAEAETQARAAMETHPAAEPVLARARQAQGKSALVSASAAPRTSPTAEAHLLAGNAHLMAGRLDDAALAYRQALRATPDFPPALGNLGNVLTAQGDLIEALALYRAALDLDPDDAEIGFAYSLALLLGGDFAEGWRWHECRRRTIGLRWNYDRHPSLPQWRDGMDLTGRRVLVMAEQGRGDMIQFARLVPLLAERAAHVVLELPRPLHRLFEGMTGVARLIDRDAPATDCDIACPLLSLPRVLGLTLDTIPPPLLRPREDLNAQWGAWLGERDGTKRIGLVVSGESRHPNDAMRSIPLDLLRPVLDLPHRFILLQTELRNADRDTRDGLEGLRWPGAALTDFADTAALMSHLDLVISVDTAAAHLAGSVGVPTWLLLPHAPDHRWMLGRADSPWYPSMRLYRQQERGAWDGVIARVRNDLPGQ